QQGRVSRQGDLENAQTTVTVDSTLCPNIASQCTTIAISDNAVQHNTCPGLPGFHNPWPGPSAEVRLIPLGGAMRGSGALPTGRAPSSAPL
ncbi:hypothetical protein ABVT39_025710, partial [Epinephelus coioides]